MDHLGSIWNLWKSSEVKVNERNSKNLFGFENKRNVRRKIISPCMILKRKDNRNGHGSGTNKEIERKREKNKKEK